MLLPTGQGPDWAFLQGKAIVGLLHQVVILKAEFGRTIVGIDLSSCQKNQLSSKDSIWGLFKLWHVLVQGQLRLSEDVGSSIMHLLHFLVVKLHPFSNPEAKPLVTWNHVISSEGGLDGWKDLTSKHLGMCSARRADAAHCISIEVQTAPAACKFSFWFSNGLYGLQLNKHMESWSQETQFDGKDTERQLPVFVCWLASVSPQGWTARPRHPPSDTCQESGSSRPFGSAYPFLPRPGINFKLL